MPQKEVVVYTARQFATAAATHHLQQPWPPYVEQLAQWIDEDPARTIEQAQRTFTFMQSYYKADIMSLWEAAQKAYAVAQQLNERNKPTPQEGANATT